jgi:hypothetical protein
VRVPLNEDCWLGHSNVQPQFAGPNYQAAVVNYVGLLHSFGLVAILDLHWTDGNYNGSHDAFCSGNANAVCQKPMPDIGAVAFWQGVATSFKNDPATVFDLFNEPFPDRAFNFATAPAWACWRDGGTTACPATAGFQYTVAGMQSLVTAVRGTGALNVIMLGGIAYSNDETGWLQFRPADPSGNLAASWHSYNFNFCNNRPPNPTNCWQTQIAPLATSVPVIAGEIGEDDCAHAYVDGLMTFLDGQGSGYLGWAWNADFDCARGPGLISAYDGTPTAFGIGLRSHLAGLP